MPYTGTIPSSTLAVGDGLPAAWTQQVGGSLSAVESAWTSYTPTLGGFTVGNGVLDGRYIQIGKLVFYEARFTFGSTSAAASASPTLTLPVAAQTALLYPGANQAWFRDASAAADYVATARVASTTVTLSILGASGIIATPSTTTPFTWTTSDIVKASGHYEAA